MVRRSEGVKEQGKKNDETETDMVVEEVIEEEESDEKITFKMPYTMEIFKQTWLMGLRIDSIPPSAHEENFGHGRTRYYQSLLIGDEYKQDRGDRRGIRHLIRLYLMRRSLEVLRKFH
ncbi:hypothetical protein Tco_0985965 [Tanacetum coccineum]